MDMVLCQELLDWDVMKSYFKVVREANGEKIKEEVHKGIRCQDYGPNNKSQKLCMYMKSYTGCSLPTM